MQTKILIIGGTGTISKPISEKLSQNPKVDLYLLNRGSKNDILKGQFTALKGDINQKSKVKALLEDRYFDVVVNFVLFDKKQALENIELFRGKVGHYVFVSSVASLNHEEFCLISEETPYGNRFSTYGQNKAKAEKVFLKAFEEENFPVTIVRPAQTYSQDRLPLSVKGKSYWPVVQRMIEGKEVLVHGDGQSLWASTHADDFADPFISLLNHDEVKGEIFQIMNNKPHTWDQVYLELARQLQVQYKPVYISKDLLKKSKKYDFMSSIQGDKTFSNLYDTSKIEAWYPELNFEISLEEGIRRFLAYMDEHEELKLEETDFDLWCDALIEKYQIATNDLMADL